MGAAVDLVLQMDEHLFALTATHGAWVYALLFAIIFAETGLVVTPVLPGDSLLFAAGTLCAAGLLNPLVMFAVLVAAAIVGDAVNYSIGRALGPRIFHTTDSRTWVRRMLRRDHLARAHLFFERHGGKAILLARFTPVLRAFVPFVAGAVAMRSGTFVFYNVTSAFVWVISCFGPGYLLGSIAAVREHFWLAALIILAGFLVPVVANLVRALLRRRVTSPILRPRV